MTSVPKTIQRGLGRHTKYEFLIIGIFFHVITSVVIDWLSSYGKGQSLTQVYWYTPIISALGSEGKRIVSR